MKLAEKHAILEEAVAKYERDSGHGAVNFNGVAASSSFKKRLEAFAADVRWYELHSGHVEQRARHSVTHLQNLF